MTTTTTPAAADLSVLDLLAAADDALDAAADATGPDHDHLAGIGAAYTHLASAWTTFPMLPAEDVHKVAELLSTARAQGAISTNDLLHLARTRVLWLQAAGRHYAQTARLDAALAGQLADATGAAGVAADVADRDVSAPPRRARTRRAPHTARNTA